MITLLTDFGLRDCYVGVMKGAIAQIDPHLRTVDLNHNIPPQDIPAARFNLLAAYAYCPQGTVHLVVVDPGVGTARRAVAVELSQGFLVGPDNGIFSGVLQQESAIAAVELNNSDYWRTPTPSRTFHGRDIFAPAAAHLASGVPIQKLGSTIDSNSLVTVDLPAYSIQAEGITGSIQYIDGFGNLISNISQSALPEPAANWGVLLKGQTIPLRQTYGEVASGQLVALIGSHGWLEVALNGGSAAETLSAQFRDRLELVHLGR
ncbi:SAM-dependent chlorinase/fluorinase [Romeria aff. gracilis LEGE 07310]|uniref:SAM-dependent chlorinase/fluorinase n=1 Tax=Vasconcelosia minhoensis LEGE 07310 TaxID=915328 RepID=A0A8J7DSE3_9CYAN|nr:SAM-dependent chlorinase/fluorinase [Romeria gracilis]MBE9080119.1 SAM-dependent chlorinase/fluorinase [Romeria aff. gracilis LEGE 07310]